MKWAKLRKPKRGETRVVVKTGDIVAVVEGQRDKKGKFRKRKVLNLKRARAH